LNNVHPFTATVDDESFVFCHNGTIFDIDLLKPSKAPDYEDRSDSRIFFERFLDQYALTGDFVEAIQTTVSVIANTCSSITSLNSFFSDGKSLVVVRYCLKEEAYYTLGYTRLRGGDDGFVITTQPYDNKSSWQWLENQTMSVFKPGGMQTVKISDR